MRKIRDNHDTGLVKSHPVWGTSFPAPGKKIHSFLLKPPVRQLFFKHKLYLTGTLKLKLQTQSWNWKTGKNDGYGVEYYCLRFLSKLFPFHYLLMQLGSVHLKFSVNFRSVTIEILLFFLFTMYPTASLLGWSTMVINRIVIFEMHLQQYIVHQFCCHYLYN